MHEELTFSISIKWNHFIGGGYGVISTNGGDDGLYRPAPAGFSCKILILRLFYTLCKRILVMYLELVILEGIWES